MLFGLSGERIRQIADRMEIVGAASRRARKKEAIFAGAFRRILAGESIQSVANTLGLNYGTLLYRCGLAGIQSQHGHRRRKQPPDIPRKSSVSWTPDLDRILTDMKAAGASATEIARRICELGTPTTRNAVMGRMHRIRSRGREPHSGWDGATSP
jgi:hypothetical protein